MLTHILKYRGDMVWMPCGCNMSLIQSPVEVSVSPMPLGRKKLKEASRKCPQMAFMLKVLVGSVSFIAGPGSLPLYFLSDMRGVAIVTWLPQPQGSTSVDLGWSTEIAETTGQSLSPLKCFTGHLATEN